MPLVQVTLLEGRNADARAHLTRELTSVVVRCIGVAPEQVRVLLYELPPENWGVGGQTKADAT